MCRSDGGGYSEVEQLNMSGSIHQNVARFQVEVQNKVRMGIGHGLQHLPKKCEPPVNTKFFLFHILIYGNALNKFHDKIGHISGSNSGIIQSGNIRMPEFGQYLMLFCLVQSILMF